MLCALLFVLSADARSLAKPVAPPPPPAVVVPVDPLGAMPTLGPATAFSVPVPAVAALSNGAELWVVPAPSLPLVTLVLTVPGGSAWDKPGKEGVAALADRMLTQGAGTRNAEQFAAEVERLGIQLDVSTGRSVSTITLSMKRDTLEPALDLLADMVLRPKLAGKDFKREQRIALSDLQQAQDEPVTVATKLAYATWFGKDHPYGRPPDGTSAGMAAAKLKDLKAYHRAAWNAAGARFTVAGALTAADATAALEPRFGQAWKATTAIAVAVPPPAPRPEVPVLLVDKPGSSQTMFYLMFPGVALGDPGLAAYRTGTIALGGTFTSRLNGLLREKRGYTYGARASVAALPKAGVLAITTRIRTDVTGPAMVDLLGELESIRKGVTDEEVAKARGAYRQDQVEAMESREGTAGTFAGWHAAGLAPDGLALELAAMGAVRREDVPAAMSAYDLSKAIIVLVGDRAVIEGPLKEAGIGAIAVVAPI